MKLITVLVNLFLLLVAGINSASTDYFSSEDLWQSKAAAL
jgi:hypothetical protein